MSKSGNLAIHYRIRSDENVDYNFISFPNLLNHSSLCAVALMGRLLEGWDKLFINDFCFFISLFSFLSKTMTHSNSLMLSATRGRISWAAIVLLFSAVLLSGGTVSAQNPALIHHTIVKTHNSPPPLGRDFWFAEQSNYWGQDLGGKYMRIYITSPVNTTAYVESNGVKTPLPVTAYGVASFKVPEFWENESSGIVENKAIHVYSNDADLTVYNMSRNAYTSDGEYIIPTIGWGTDYVVAAYGSLFEGSGTYVYDLPSTCIVVANQDNTSGTITPLCDCRQCQSGNISGDANSAIAVYPANQPIPFQLNRGQCLQLMPVKAQDPDNYDMTGTIIHSNQPVGVAGGSGCPNIPADRPYCDHVEDMMPPVRTWAETYYTTNPIQPPGSFDDYARYLFISSKPGQTIYKYNCNQGASTECKIDAQYGIYWDELEAGERFSSDAPFLCVWYINSATYPDGANGNGDPAECVINPKEQYTKTVVFETPTTVGNIVPFTNYANIICRKQDASKTLFDHKSILGHGASCLDDTFEIFNIPGIAPGAHIVQGPDSGEGVGVYIYGYGYDESYAWTGSFGTGTFHSPDTVAPLADTIGVCTNSFVHVSDSGLLPDGKNKQSGLGEIRIDSIYNMTYMPDAPAFIEGSGADSSGYGMFVIDPTKPAILVVSVFDLAGNRDSITSIYKPLADSIKPPLQNLGVWNNGAPPNYAYDTIFNDGVLPLTIGTIKLKYGNVGFTLIDSIGGGVDLSPIPPGKFRLIPISFKALVPTKVVDSILVDPTGCFPLSAAVIGSGGAADFIVTDQVWPNELLTQPTTCYTSTVKVENLSSGVLKVDSAYLPDPHFSFVPGQFPIVIPPSPAFTKVNIIYCPDSGSLTAHNRMQGQWFSKQVAGGEGSPRFDSLTGWAIGPSSSFIADILDSVSCLTVPDTIISTFRIAATGNSQTTIERVVQSNPANFINLMGTVDGANTTWDPKTTTQTLNPLQTATISVTCIVPPQLDATFVDTLTATDGNEATIGVPLTVTIVATYAAAAVGSPNTVFAPVQYQESNSANTTRNFTVQNTANSPLQVDGFTFVPGVYNSAFTIGTVTLLPANTLVTLPYSVPIGGSLLVTYSFNDSVSNDPTQTATLLVKSSNSCTYPTDTLRASVTHPGPQTSSFVATPILSCDTRTDNATISNSGAKTASFNASLTVQSVQWLGPDNFFSTTLAPGTVIDGSTNFGTPTPTNATPNIVPNTMQFPITFSPPASTAVTTYTNQIQITFVNSDGTIATQVVPVTGIAGGAEVSANSVVANVTTPSDGKTGHVNDQLTMPATVSVGIPGALTGVTVDQLAITGVQLTYVIPNRDLLTFTGFNLDLSLKNSGWSAKPVRLADQNGKGPGTGVGDTIIYLLTGPTPLSANTTAFGTFEFTTDLSGLGDNTPVTLQPLQLFTGPNGDQAVGACINNDVQSQDFTLIEACGDTTLRAVLDGHGSIISFVGPATPDPVSDGHVTMKYTNRGAATLTLAIYDALGNEVSRPVNNLYQEAGTWQVTTDVSKLPSGTYTYRLSGTSATGPMVASDQFVIKR